MSNTMFLWFEDWTQLLHMLTQKGMEHGDHLYKVYCDSRHPSLLFNRDTMLVFEESGEPFVETEIFLYEGRESWSGPQVEEVLKRRKFSEEKEQIARALFRFAHRSEFQFCQSAMGLKKPETNEWRFDDPWNDIDFSRDKSSGNKAMFHLDIFLPQSLERLRSFIEGRIRAGDLTQEAWCVSLRERMAAQRLNKEGGKGPNSKEKG